METTTNTGDTINNNSKINSNTTIIASQQIREDLISTAVTFLRNPKVIRSPLNQKQKFLRTKGLTENEIQVACERAGVFTDDPNSTLDKTIINIETEKKYIIPKQTTFGKIKEILNTVALLSGVTYAVYLFYKRFIEPFLFGSKKKKSLDDNLNDIEKKIDTTNQKISTELQKVHDDLKVIKENEYLTRDLNNFKSELETIKGLLLNRAQFSGPPLSSRPSVPDWQLSGLKDKKNDESLINTIEPGEMDSSSSEPEVISA